MKTAYCCENYLHVNKIVGEISPFAVNNHIYSILVIASENLLQ